MTIIAKGITPRHFVLLGAFFAVAGFALLMRPPTVLAQNSAQPEGNLCYAVANVRYDRFYTLDPETGAPVVVGAISTTATLPEDQWDPQGGRDREAPTDIEALAFAPSRNPDDNRNYLELFAASQRNFGVIDLTTAAFTPIGSIANGFGSVNGIQFNNVDGLAYDRHSDRLFAAQRRRAMGEPDLLFLVNMETGTYVPDAFGPGQHYVEMIMDGLSDLDDIAVDSTIGPDSDAPRLYGTMNEVGDGAADGRRNEPVVLVTIDPDTGAIAKVGDIVAAGGSPVFDVEGLTFDRAGNLYATSGWNYHHQLNRFYQIDKRTGSAVQVRDLGAMDRLYDTEAIACPPYLPPAITIEKSCNGADADEPDQAPRAPEGSELRWNYVITNTGGLNLVDIVLTDDPAGPVTCPQTGLAIGDSMTCTLTRTAESEEGLVANLGTVIGYGEGYDDNLDRDNVRVQASDPSHCLVVPSAIGLGSAMEFRWHYRLQNPDPRTPERAQELVDVSLDTGPGIATALVINGSSEDDVLNVGETWTYSVTVPAQPIRTYSALYTNPVTATAVTSATVSLPVSGTCQPLPYLLDAVLSVTALLNGNDASTSPGLNVSADEALEWRYRVVNESAVTVTDVEVQQIEVAKVSDSLPAPCADMTLLPGEFTTCTTSGTAASGLVTTVATVAGRVAISTTCETPTRTSIPVVENVLTYYNDDVSPDAQVRSRVFRDLAGRISSANGCQDPDETGIDAVNVLLVNAANSNDRVTPVDTVAGIYTFDVRPGTYYLQFEVPAEHAMFGMRFTAPNRVDNEQLDSDVEWTTTHGDGSVGRTAPFAVGSGDVVTGYDAGLVVPYVAELDHIYLPFINR